MILKVTSSFRACWPVYEYVYFFFLAQIVQKLWILFGHFFTLFSWPKIALAAVIELSENHNICNNFESINARITNKVSNESPKQALSDEL